MIWPPFFSRKAFFPPAFPTLSPSVGHQSKTCAEPFDHTQHKLRRSIGNHSILDCRIKHPRIEFDFFRSCIFPPIQNRKSKIQNYHHFPDFCRAALMRSPTGFHSIQSRQTKLSRPCFASRQFFHTPVSARCPLRISSFRQPKATGAVIIDRPGLIDDNRHGMNGQYYKDGRWKRRERWL